MITTPATALTEDMNIFQMMNCSVCLETLIGSSHRVLPCQHTFHTRCLEQLVDKTGELKCPECREVFQKLVSDLPPNVTLARLLGQINIPNSFLKHKEYVGPTLITTADSSTPSIQSSHRHPSGSNAPRPNVPVTTEALQELEASRVPMNTKRKTNSPHHHTSIVSSSGQCRPSASIMPPFLSPLEACQRVGIHGTPLSGASDFIPNTRARAIYSFAGEHPSDLAFREGETLTLLSRTDENWYSGCNRKGSAGQIPSNYIKIITTPPIPPFRRVTTTSNNLVSQRPCLQPTPIATTNEAIATDHQPNQPPTIVVSSQTIRELIPQPCPLHDNAHSSGSSRSHIHSSSQTDFSSTPLLTANQISCFTQANLGRSPKPGDLFTAVYDHISQDAVSPGNRVRFLSFRKGDFITYISACDEVWSFGRIGDNEGLFPMNFVTKTNVMDPVHQTEHESEPMVSGVVGTTNQSQIFVPNSSTSSAQSQPFELTGSTGTNQSQPFAITASTGTNQSQPFAITASTGTNQSQPFAMSTSTGINQSQPFAMTTSTGTIQSQPFAMTASTGNNQSHPFALTVTTRTAPLKPSEITNTSFRNQLKMFAETSSLQANQLEPQGLPMITSAESHNETQMSWSTRPRGNTICPPTPPASPATPDTMATPLVPLTTPLDTIDLIDFDPLPISTPPVNRSSPIVMDTPTESELPSHPDTVEAEGLINVYRGLYNYSPRSSDELSVVRGHHYRIDEMLHDGWCRSVNIETGDAGMIPSTHVNFPTTFREAASTASTSVSTQESIPNSRRNMPLPTPPPPSVNTGLNQPCSPRPAQIGPRTPPVYESLASSFGRSGSQSNTGRATRCACGGHHYHHLPSVSVPARPVYHSCVDDQQGPCLFHQAMIYERSQGKPMPSVDRRLGEVLSTQRPGSNSRDHSLDRQGDSVMFRSHECQSSSLPSSVGCVPVHLKQVYGKKTKKKQFTPFKGLFGRTNRSKSDVSTSPSQSSSNNKQTILQSSTAHSTPCSSPARRVVEGAGPPPQLHRTFSGPAAGGAAQRSTDPISELAQAYSVTRETGRHNAHTVAIILQQRSNSENDKGEGIQATSDQLHTFSASIQERNFLSCFYRCSTPFPTSTDDELAMECGDLIKVLECRPDGWLKGQHQRTGEIGYVPSNFVERIQQPVSINIS